MDFPGHSTRKLRDRFTPLKWIMVFFIVFEVGLMIANGTEIYCLRALGFDPYYETDTFWLGFSVIAGISGIGYTLTYVLMVIFVCMWTYRAMKNLHIIRSPHAEMSPAWAVGWYFIPFANLFQPFLGMSQIWRGSRRAAGLAQEIPAIMGIWWGLWVILSIASNLSFRLSGFETEGPGYENSLIVDTILAPFWILCTILLMNIVSKVTKAQDTLPEAAVLETF